MCRNLIHAVVVASDAEHVVGHLGWRRPDDPGRGRHRLGLLDRTREPAERVVGDRRPAHAGERVAFPGDLEALGIDVDGHGQRLALRRGGGAESRDDEWVAIEDLGWAVDVYAAVLAGG